MEQKPRKGIGFMAITLTEPAAKRVRHFIDKDGGVGLRLGVKKTGCSGWAYTVELARAIDSDDVVFEHGDVKVIVAHDSPRYSATHIDLSNGEYHQLKSAVLITTTHIIITFGVPATARIQR